MAKKIKSKDPFFERERKKYAHPIPSREHILETLEELGKPVPFGRILKILNIENPEQQEALGFRLKAMLRDGQLMQDRRERYCLMKRINLQRGTIHAHPDGFGFFIPDLGGGDWVLSGKEMRMVMHGDIVLAYQAGLDRRGRVEGKIHEIVERANTQVAGRFFTEHGVGFVVPDSRRLTHEISIPAEFSKDAKNGQMVLVSLIAYPSKRTQAVGKVERILGEHMAPGMEIEMALLAHAIPAQWPSDVLQEAKQVSTDVLEKDKIGRADLTDLPFVTIDGEDARDFDDAVYACQKPRGGYQLYVAIADVSYYVHPDSALDKEAQRRGNSVYFPEQVIPMLPEHLSNGICSLNPHQDRLCMVAEMAINAEGNLTRTRFYRAVIHSKARLTYTEVGKWLEEKQVPSKFSAIADNIMALQALYSVLLNARISRGAMDFDSIETKIEFDAERKIQQIVPSYRNDAHRLIEECMLVANVAAARFLEKSKLPVLYRVHSVPDADKISNLRTFLGEFGLQLGGGSKPSPKDFQAVLVMAKNLPEQRLIETVLLRSLKQAQYVETNDGHFGLAYLAYTHFTSPIRRYPDLLVHRAIMQALADKSGGGESYYQYSEAEITRLGQHCSLTERRADDATRDVVSWLKCEYMQNKLGEVFEGTISAVMGFGIFVTLDSVYVEGLVHVTALKNDYYQFDPIKHRMVGERSGKKYQLGDAMRVMVSRVDLDERKIDFEPVE